MDSTLIILLCLSFFALMSYVIIKPIIKLKRQEFIDEYQFPKRLNEQLKKQYPHLTNRQITQVIKGLREYFHICNIAGRKMVAMPSQAVDVAWHEFILFTKDYQKFCKRAFGRFLHHTPAEAMPSPTTAQRGIKNTWKIACMRQNITAHKATRLPLLFALDSRLEIPDGFSYTLNCTKNNKSTGQDYCGTHILTSESDSGCDNFDDPNSSAGDGCSSGCGGGCGGD